MSEMNPQSAEPDQNPTRYRNKIQNLLILHPPPCPAGAAKRVGGPPNARKLPRNELDKDLAKCQETYHASPSSRNPPAWLGKIHGISFFSPNRNADVPIGINSPPVTLYPPQRLRRNPPSNILNLLFPTSPSSSEPPAPSNSSPSCNESCALLPLLRHHPTQTPLA
jgi:hypothetical protein